MKTKVGRSDDRPFTLRPLTVLIQEPSIIAASAYLLPNLPRRSVSSSYMDKRTREELLRKYCGELHEDDAIDPRDYFKLSRPIDKNTKKAKQLCRQVAETLEMVLSGDTRDEVLSCLHVVSVIPAPDSSRLLVTLQPDFAENQFQREEIEERLARHQGRLRTEVAAAIHRKKTPTLAFNVIQKL